MKGVLQWFLLNEVAYINKSSFNHIDISLFTSLRTHYIMNIIKYD